MFYFYSYIICGLAMIISTWMGLRSPIEKHTADALVITRLLILIMLVLKFINLFLRFPLFSKIIFLQIIALIILLTITEMVFRRKRLTFGNPWLSLVLELLTIVCAFLCILQNLTILKHKFYNKIIQRPQCNRIAHEISVLILGVRIPGDAFFIDLL